MTRNKKPTVHKYDATGNYALFVKTYPGAVGVFYKRDTWEKYHHVMSYEARQVAKGKEIPVTTGEIEYALKILQEALNSEEENNFNNEAL